MKNLLFALLMIGLTPAIQADEKTTEIKARLQKIKHLSNAIKKRLHPEVMEAVLASDKESMIERLNAHEAELKKINTQLKEQFNQLDAEAQRDILLRESRNY